MQQVVTFTGYEVKTGNGQKGPWTLKTYKDAGGNKFQTFDAGIQAIADGLIGVAVNATWEVEQRSYTDNDGNQRTANNNKLTSVEASGAQPAPQPQQPQAYPNSATGGFPVAQPPQPVQQPVAVQAPDGDRGAIIGAQWAVNAALEAHSNGIAVCSGPEQLEAIAVAFKQMAARVAAA